MQASENPSSAPSGATAPAKSDSLIGRVCRVLFSGEQPLDDRHERIKIEQPEKYPDGYPRLAAVVNSDDNFVIYRRFGRLQARQLLELEAELTELEEELDRIDSTQEKDSELEPNLHNRERAENSERSRLMRKISERKHEYNCMVLQEHQLRSIPRPTPTNRKSIFDHIYQEKFLDEGEYNHIFHVEDMIAPGYNDSEDDWVKSFVQSIFQKLPSRRLQFPKTP
ncbi:hypothetical protein GP486_001534 [Trichoglossum hirsutum]|uniref:DUF6594 domain-containing protein n=1 Tax=Trichoglossum hirsutum TaxID=265104 RepID=A0A9P8LGU4_9PEZI|nr:hypothetical protein GP486_001534 [Trichoglossum hirsutum]